MVKITKKGQKAWVTFSVIPESGEDLAICGEWNDWQDEPMKVKKSGEFYITKILPTGKEYQFGYRVNKEKWQCESELECVQSPFGSFNNLLKL
jgi:1,4-alpha-glucan branching enzyme